MFLWMKTTEFDRYKNLLKWATYYFILDKLIAMCEEQFVFWN